MQPIWGIVGVLPKCYIDSNSALWFSDQRRKNLAEQGISNID